MSRLIINTGTKPNDKSGDTLQAAFTKVNANFEELYAITGGSSTTLQELIQDTIAAMISNGTLVGLNATYNDPAGTLNLYNTDALIDGGDALDNFNGLIFDGGLADSIYSLDMQIQGGAA